jgi:uncharacterized protein YegL
MSIFDNATVRKPRPLPVILLADVSGSMEEEDRIGVLNRSVTSMIQALQRESDVVGQIQLSVIIFGGDEARVHIPLAAVSDAEWLDMVAYGRTPMGHAFQLAAQTVDDRSLIPDRSYQPTIVLLSDGLPTDDWAAGLKILQDSPRGRHSQRLAVNMNVRAGSEQYDILEQFVGLVPGRVYQASASGDIAKALQWVTFSVTSRARSNNPNDIDPIDPGDFEG